MGDKSPKNIEKRKKKAEKNAAKKAISPISSLLKSVDKPK